MKNPIFILILACSSFSLNLRSQNNFALEGGYGFFEGTHLRAKFQSGKLALGAGYGTAQNMAPYSHGDAKNYMLFASYYYGKVNRHQFYRNYVYADLEHVLYEQFIKDTKVYALSLGIGHDFYLTRYFGIAVQGGLFLSASGNVEYNTDIREKAMWILPVMPEAAVRFFIRI